MNGRDEGTADGVREASGHSIHDVRPEALPDDIFGGGR